MVLLVISKICPNIVLVSLLMSLSMYLYAFKCLREYYQNLSQKTDVFKTYEEVQSSIEKCTIFVK